MKVCDQYDNSVTFPLETTPGTLWIESWVGPRAGLDAIYLYVCVSRAPLLGLGRFFSFFIFYAVCRIHCTGDQPDARPLPAHRTPQTQNKRTQTSMPQVGFEPRIPVFERAKTVNALGGAATVIGWSGPSGRCEEVNISWPRREYRLAASTCGHVFRVDYAKLPFQGERNASAAPD
jgi:hypothetical protein